jgi:hypothetical protein
MFNNFNFFINDKFWQILNVRLIKILFKKLSWFLFKKIWNFLWNIPRIKQSKKQSQRGGCGSCYYVCTHETFVIELDVLIITCILDIEQQDEVERCI